MKQVILWAGGVIVVLAVGFGVYQVMWNDDKKGSGSETVQTGENATAGATKTACDIFTDDVATQILGAGATKSDLPDTANASTDDVSVSNCVYEIDDPNSEGILTAGVLVRGGKTDTGKSSNNFGFGDNKTLDADGGKTGSSEAVSGIGDEAYFSPAFEQVNVLVGDGTYWLIVQADTRAQSEQLAKLLVEKL